MYAQDQAAKLRELVESVHASVSPRVIAITSGKGGTGKSTLAVNLAVTLRRLGKRVLLIDADFGLANVDLMLGVPSRKTLAQVLSGEITPAEAVQEAIGGVRFLSGGSGVEALLNMGPESVGTMIEPLLQLQGDTDMILLDTGAGVTPVVLRLLEAASEAVVVTTPEPTAVMDAYALIKTLSRQRTPPALRLVINRVDNQREAAETSDAIISLARKNIQLAIDHLGAVFNDPYISQSIKRQVPIVVSHPSAQVSRDVQLIARKLLGLSGVPSANGFASFLKKLVGARNR